MKLIVTSSTFPVADDDPVSAFVKDQLIALKQLDPSLDIIVLAPHNAYSQTARRLSKHDAYCEIRYHYFWPHRLELLAGRSIMPALHQNKLLYLQIPFFLIGQVFSLWRLVRREKPDLIYAHWFMPQAISAVLVSKLTDVSFVFTTHASDVSVLHKVPGGRRLVAWVCRRARAYTAVSQRTADKLRAFFTSETWQNDYARKLSIVSMGVHRLAKLEDSEVRSALMELNVPTHKQLLVFIGRLAEKKGVSYLLEALGQLGARQRDDLCVVIAGDGQLRAQLEQQAGELGLTNVLFSGYVHGKLKQALFQAADFMCFPSIIDSMNDSEGFPVAIMEALAAGKLVLASDASSAESVIESGTSGILFAQKSSGDLAHAITAALALSQDQRQAIAAQASKLADQFNWQTVARQHLSIFTEALHG